jgi:hypothetical protein
VWQCELGSASVDSGRELTFRVQTVGLSLAYGRRWLSFQVPWPSTYPGSARNPLPARRVLATNGNRSEEPVRPLKGGRVMDASCPELPPFGDLPNPPSTYDLPRSRCRGNPHSFRGRSPSVLRPLLRPRRPVTRSGTLAVVLRRRSAVCAGTRHRAAGKPPPRSAALQRPRQLFITHRTRTGAAGHLSARDSYKHARHCEGNRPQFHFVGLEPLWKVAIEAGETGFEPLKQIGGYTTKSGCRSDHRRQRGSGRVRSLLCRTPCAIPSGCASRTIAFRARYPPSSSRFPRLTSSARVDPCDGTWSRGECEPASGCSSTTTLWWPSPPREPSPSAWSVPPGPRGSSRRSQMA